MNNMVVLDTHILLWSLLEPEVLTDSIKHQIAEAQEGSELFISSISLWEIAMLNSKKRISIYQPLKEFLSSIVNIKGLTVVDIDPDIATESVQLADEFHGDPADRIIVATSRCLGATLLTKDQKILEWGKLGHIKLL